MLEDGITSLSYGHYKIEKAETVVQIPETETGLCPVPHSNGVTVVQIPETIIQKAEPIVEIVLTDKERIRRAQEAYFIKAAQRKIQQAEEKIRKDQKWKEMMSIFLSANR